ncbi:uncharacterized protein N0V89_008168 [Didymosphaeria variabile]|uniref:Lipocalin-like domain-containing protein n=1 Tax=Didymosphaeria variabile TaxID=1932322 RepID=A0A9W9C936_9PLEO|nr:uncharacterized protein N0V89_008168 [Didymosphaeria variabile]KAJ4349552.1 hypothetical protein N0V89_008168 [Didymosphaeria variabile]
MKTPEQLVALLSGAWTIYNQTSVYPNGTAVPRAPDAAQGPNGTGVILCPSSFPLHLFLTNRPKDHPTMQMSAILTPTLPAYRPHNLTYGKFDNTTDADWAILGKHNLAYAAPFTLTVLPEEDNDDGVVVHGPLLSNVPSYDGAFFKRNFTIIGEGEEYGKWLRLVIRNETSGVRNLVVWRKRG